MGKILSRIRKRRQPFDGGVQTYSSDPNLSNLSNKEAKLPRTTYSRPSTRHVKKSKLERKYESEPNILTQVSQNKIVETAIDDRVQEHGKLNVVETTAIIVAAIDIGSAYSGYVFVLKGEFLKDNKSIHCPTWKSADATYYKTTSAILFKPDGSFFKFGSEAERFYTEVMEDELTTTSSINNRNINTWYYFQHFKMLLYERKDDISKDMTIKDIQGKEMKAVDVFSGAIKFFKDHLLGTLTTMFGQDSTMSNDDIEWVITVPAIWDMRAKQFMRDAANKAGIRNQQLFIALEPEAASLYCRQVPVASRKSKSESTLKTLEEGNTYIVLDQGGGTIDICVHQILPDNHLKEIYQANGGNWGGNLVNEKFLEYLSHKLGENVIQKVKQEHPPDYAEIMNTFEKKKRCYDDTSEEASNRVVIQIPAFFMEAYEQLHNMKYSGDLKIERGKIYLPTNIFQEFFHEPLDKIIDHITCILDKLAQAEVKSILAVGGFSESTLLIARIKEKFPTMNVIVPKDSGLAVLKGAIMFGFYQSVIKTRISRFTYGIKVEKEISENLEENYRKIRKDQSSGKKYAVDVFEILVTIGEEIQVGELQRPREYDPVHVNQKHASIEFYATTAANPVHVTDEGCIEIGTLEVDMRERDQSGGSLSLQINAGGTEISAIVTDNKTGKIFQGHFCLP